MAYEPTVWNSGDIITAEKLNKLENGVGSGGGEDSNFFVVHADVTVTDSEGGSSLNATSVDKTGAEIKSANQEGKVVILIASVTEGISKREGVVFELCAIRNSYRGDDGIEIVFRNAENDAFPYQPVFPSSQYDTHRIMIAELYCYTETGKTDEWEGWRWSFKNEPVLESVYTPVIAVVCEYNTHDARYYFNVSFTDLAAAINKGISIIMMERNRPSAYWVYKVLPADITYEESNNVVKITTVRNEVNGTSCTVITTEYTLDSNNTVSRTQSSLVLTGTTL